MYQSVQGGRAVAAVLVVLFHLGGAIASDKYFGIPFFAVPFSFGGAGVEFFFVLSGFIIYTVHRNDLSQPHKVFDYLKKRCIRIYPTYWMIWLPTFVLATLSSGLQHTVPKSISVIIQSLLLLPQNKEIIGGTGSPVLIVAWTLQYEIFFYLCFALLLIRRWLFVTAGIVFLLLYSLHLGNKAVSFPLSFLVQDYILLFGMGMGVSALCFSDITSKVRPLRHLFFGTTLFTVVALDTITNALFLSTWKTLLYGFASCFILFGLIKSEDQGHIYFQSRWMQSLGDASYVMYLIHYPLISVLCKVMVAIKLRNAGIFGACVAYVLILSACLLFSVAFHRWLEKPTTSFLRKHWI